MRVFSISALFLLFCLGSMAQDAEFRPTGLDGTLWVQTAIEYDMNCRQAYAMAQLQLDKALADKTWTAALEQTGNFADLPPAVILDVDETVLDNSPFQAHLLMNKEVYEGRGNWDEWQKARSAEAIPGVLDFVRYARSKGVTVFYVTNRQCWDRNNPKTPCPQQTDTMENLKALGFPDVTEETMMLRGEQADWQSEKDTRRAKIAETHRILLLCGDDLGDFLAHVKKKPVAQRSAETKKYQEYWGTRWIVLPNPLYGSWLNVLKNKDSYLKGFQKP